LRDESREHHEAEAGYVNPNYFRMLQEVSAVSPAPSAAASSGGSSAPSSVGGDLGDEDDGDNGEDGDAASDASRAAVELVSSAPASPHATQGISAAAFSPNYFKRFFVEEGVLGRGGRGVVLLVKHVLDGVSLGHFACKRVPVGDDHDWLEKVLVEVQLLQHLSHQNLVSYRHVWLEDVQFTKFGPSVPCAFILQQYCNGGDLHRYISQPPQPTTTEELKGRMRRRSKGQLEQPESMHARRQLSFDEIYSFFRDIASGLRHLHANGFIHRDLKPSNCLLHSTGPETRVLVSDFGEAQRESAARRSTGTTGTVSYCAPEVLRPQYADGPLGEFSAKSDVFSLGMILYFMCFASLPYSAADDLDEDREDVDRLKDEISHWAGFDDQARARPDLPDKLYKFLKRLLALDPAQRPTADEILHSISTGGGLSDYRAHSRQPSALNIFDHVPTGPRLSPIETPQTAAPASVVTSCSAEGASPGALSIGSSGVCGGGGHGGTGETGGRGSPSAASGKSWRRRPRPWLSGSGSLTLREQPGSDESGDERGYGGTSTDSSLVLRTPLALTPTSSGTPGGSSRPGSSPSPLLSTTAPSNHTLTEPLLSATGRRQGAPAAQQQLLPMQASTAKYVAAAAAATAGAKTSGGSVSRIARQRRRQTAASSTNHYPSSSSSFAFTSWPGLSAAAGAIPSGWLVPLKAGVFVFKLCSLTVPCSPAAANGWILYPLVCLATVDLSLGFGGGGGGGGRVSRRGVAPARGVAGGGGARVSANGIGGSGDGKGVAAPRRRSGTASPPSTAPVNLNGAAAISSSSSNSNSRSRSDVQLRYSSLPPSAPPLSLSPTPAALPHRNHVLAGTNVTNPIPHPSPLHPLPPSSLSSSASSSSSPALPSSPSSPFPSSFTTTTTTTTAAAAPTAGGARGTGYGDAAAGPFGLPPLLLTLALLTVHLAALAMAARAQLLCVAAPSSSRQP
jgi:serine/threonine protein kinase